MVEIRIKQGKRGSWRAIMHFVDSGDNIPLSKVRGFASYDEAVEDAETKVAAIQNQVNWFNV